MSTRGRENRSRERALLRQGLGGVVGERGTMRLQGRDVPLREVVDALDLAAARAKATEEAKAAYHRAVALEKEAEALVAPMEKAVRALLHATATDEQLLSCGVRPKKPRRPLDADERSAATAKLRATRDRNGTRGVRQRRRDEAREVIRRTYEPRGPDVDARTAEEGTSPAERGTQGPWPIRPSGALAHGR